MNYEYVLKRHTERVGALSVELQCLESLDRTIDTLFEHLQRSGREADLERLCPYFGVVWPSARGLAGALEELGHSVLAGKRVLEIGCGLAVPAFVAASLGGRVTATDFHPEVPRFLERNRALNADVQIDYLELNWSSADQSGEFDWVIGSDILYERQQPELVARTLQSTLKPGGRALIADPARPYLQVFVDEMRKKGFIENTSVRRVPDTDSKGTKDIFIIEFSRGTEV